jgi:hypothetical protein
MTLYKVGSIVVEVRVCPTSGNENLPYGISAQCETGNGIRGKIYLWP